MRNLIKKFNVWFNESRILLACNLLFLLTYYLYSQGYLAPVAELFNQGGLFHANTRYLEHLESRYAADLGELLLLGSMLDVATSSQFGISFIVDVNVQVGQLLGELSQLVQRGQDYLLIAISGIEALQSIAALSDYLSPLLFKWTLLFVCVWCFIALFKRSVLTSEPARHLLRVLVMAFMLTHLAVPYSIHLSSGLTQVVDDLLGYNTNHHYFGELSQEFSGAKTGQQSDLKQHGKDGVKLLHKAAASKLHHKVERSAHTIMQSAAHLLLTLVLIPGLLLFVWYRLIRRFIAATPRLNKTLTNGLTS